MQIPLGDTYYLKFTTRSFSTGAPTTLSGTPAISVYEENNLTEITSGVTLTVDYDSVTGLNDVAIVATSGNGYEAGKYYSAVVTTGTVGGVSVVGEVVGHFRIMAAESAAGVPETDLQATQSNTVTFPAINITGLLNIDDGIDVTCSTAGRDALKLTGNGAGDGMNVNGGSDGHGAVFTANGSVSHGMLLTGAGTGDGINSTGGSGGGDGIQANGANGGSGFIGVGNGSAGHGMELVGGAGGGDGLNAFGGTTSGDGIRAVGQGTGAGLFADIEGDITGSLSGSVNSVTSGVSLANGAITDASLAGNMEIVFETDFATNYNATRNAWATNVQDFVGTSAADPFNGQVVAASVTSGVTLANGAVTDASLAGNMEIVFETDFATNYNTTANAWNADMVAISTSTAAADNLEASALGIITGATSGTPTTTSTNTDLTGYADDELIGRVVVFTGGTAAGQATDITDYASTSGVLTYTALTTAPAASDTFVIV